MANDSSEGKLLAFLAYLFTPFSALLILLLKKDNQYVTYHSRQALALGIAAVVIWAVVFIGTLLTFGFGGIILGPLGMIFGLVLLVIGIIGIINALTGKMKPLPLIGKYGDKINL